MEEEKISSYDFVNNGNPYKVCLEKAGAKVFAFQDFGSYQGNWFAFIEHQGKKYLVGGAYGSCSGCDAFAAEADYEDRTPTEWEALCKTFGEPYLNDPMDLGNEIKKFKEESSWDSDALEVVKFLEEGAREWLRE
jgi:hypothetical protein